MASAAREQPADGQEAPQDGQAAPGDGGAADPEAQAGKSVEFGTAAETADVVTREGARDLRRGTPELAISGLIAGLDIGFGPLAMAFVAGHLTGHVDTQIAFLIGALLYPIGFTFVVLGRSELFTEQTLTPVVALFARKGTVLDLLRYWSVVFVMNQIGVALFALGLVNSGPIVADYLPIYDGAVKKLLAPDFRYVLLSAIAAGWVIAILSWLVEVVDSSLARIACIWVASIFIVLGPLHHSIVGSGEVLVAVFQGQVSVADWLVRFLLPATLGNVIGGVVFVTSLVWAQTRSA
jgi:formate/nitrite transporter FocA (FNT family)